MIHNPLPRLDADCEIRKALLPYCRLKAGDIWEDAQSGHRVGCLDAASGTTLLAAEINRRRCFTMDIDPLFCEITIRRLEHFRRTGRVGWQNGHAFEDQYVCPVQGEVERSKVIAGQSKIAQTLLL